MGLAVVFGIVNNHGGAITVESSAGKGSLFNVFLPHAEAQARSQEERMGRSPRAARNGYSSLTTSLSSWT